MTTLVIIIERESLLSTVAHIELIQLFLSLFVHVKTIFGRRKKTQNKKRCNGIDHSVVLLKDTSIHLLDAQESTCWFRLIEFKWVEQYVAFSDVVASLKPEKYVNLLLKRQQWKLNSKESKCRNARKMNGQRKPMTRDWRPSPRRSRFNLLVATSQLKRVDRWLEIVLCVWPNIRRKLMEDIVENRHTRALYYFAVYRALGP